MTSTFKLIAALTLLSITSSAGASAQDAAGSPGAIIRFEKYATYFKNDSVDGIFIADNIRAGNQLAFEAYTTGCQKWETTLADNMKGFDGQIYIIDLMKREASYLESSIRLAEINARDECNGGFEARCETLNRETETAIEKRNAQVGKVNAQIDAFDRNKQEYNIEVDDYNVVCKSLWWM